jgi:hypothetical protein
MLYKDSYWFNLEINNIKMLSNKSYAPKILNIDTNYIMKDMSVNKHKELEYMLISFGTLSKETIPEQIVTIKIPKLSKSVSNNTKYWKSGTGYGGEGAMNWDIKTYIKEFYEVSYYPREKQILLHDIPESQTRTNKIDIGRVGRVKITLMWGKIEEITGVQYHHKEFQSELSKFFVNLITEKKSKDFFKLMTEENIPVSFTLNEMIDEFPVLND